jgi:hypothetical protein
MLQWGRDLMIAEIVLVRTMDSKTGARFNRAAIR